MFKEKIQKSEHPRFVLRDIFSRKHGVDTFSYFKSIFCEPGILFCFALDSGWIALFCWQTIQRRGWPQRQRQHWTAFHVTCSYAKVITRFGLYWPFVL